MEIDELEIDELRKEAEKIVAKDPTSVSLRSCWKCNPAHEHLKEINYVICCFACGNFFYKGQNITRK